MRQGWKAPALGAFLTACALIGAPMALPTVDAAHAAGRTAAADGAAKSKNTQRQFTGIVVALDKSTLTVEKRGKKAQSRVFTRHAELKTEGDLVKDARVTVYYREQGGRAVAHRVVVKPQNGGGRGGR